MIHRLSFCLFLALHVTGATAADFQCAGVLPAWTLDVSGDNSDLTTDTIVNMQVMDQTHAEGRDWPLALTLVGDRDTAILLIERESCQINDQSTDFQAQVLTQRGTTPILLTGCCTVQE